MRKLLAFLMLFICAAVAQNPPQLTVIGVGPISAAPTQCRSYQDIWMCSQGTCAAPKYLCVNGSWQADGGSSAYGGANVYTASHTIGASDIGKLVVMNCSAACTVAFEASPAATDWFGIESVGSTVATISLNGKTYNGSVSVPVLNTYRDLRVSSDGANFFGDAPLVAGSGMSLVPASNGVTLNSSAGGNLTLQDNSGSTVGSRAILQILNGTYLTCALADTGTKLTQQCDANTVKLVDRTQANTWTAGAKQIFQASGTTEGLNLAPAALPSAAAAGALAVDASNTLNLFDGSGWNKAVTTTTTLTSGVPVVGAGTNKVGLGTTTGTGNFVLSSSPTISLPVITDFSNAGHDHHNVANGGQLSNTAIAAANLQGNGTKFLMAGTVSGTAATLCTDASGNATTTGCSSSGMAVGGAVSGATNGELLGVNGGNLAQDSALLWDFTNHFQTIVNNAVASTSTDGLVLSNTTAATSGQQQWSPRLHWIGQGWKTNATAASQQTEWTAELRPLAESSGPESILTMIPTVAGTAKPGIAFCAGPGAAQSGTFITGLDGAGSYSCNTSVGFSGLGPANGSGVFAVWVNSAERLNFHINGIGMPNTSSLMWVNGGSVGNNTTGDISLDRDAAGVVGVYNGTAAGTTAANYRDIKLRHTIASGSPPTITSGFGTSPSIAGGDEGGRITVGTGGTATTGVITFGTAYTTNAPACTANDEGTILLVQAKATTSTLTLTSATAWTAGETITWTCKGY